MKRLALVVFAVALTLSACKKAEVSTEVGAPEVSTGTVTAQ